MDSFHVWRGRCIDLVVDFQVVCLVISDSEAIVVISDSEAARLRIVVGLGCCGGATFCWNSIRWLGLID